MRKIQLVAILLLASLTIQGQHDECGFVNPPLDHLQLKKGQIKSNESCKNTLRVHFYILRDDNGEGGVYDELLADGLVTSEDDYINQHMEILNTAFAFSAYPDKLEEEIHSGNSYGEDIQFVLEGWDYFDSTFKLEQNSPGPLGFMFFQSSNTAINVYLGSTGTYSKANLPIIVAKNSGIVLTRNAVLSSTMAHEMGHSIGLFHPYDRVGKFQASTGNYIGGPDSEVYTLTEEFPFGENCATTSDGVCDTYPAPSAFGSDANCEFVIGGAAGYPSLMPLVVGESLNINEIEAYDTFPFARLETNGDPYQFRQHDNFMGGGSSRCKNKFTPGQSLRMHSFLDIVSSVSNAYSDLDFRNTHTSQVTQQSECGAYDGAIEVSLPKGASVTAVHRGDTLVNGVQGTLLLDNLGPGVYGFLVEGETPCQVYYFEEIQYIPGCSYDIDGNNSVGISDLLIVTSSLGNKCCPADFNDDDFVNEMDEEQLLAALETGICPDGDCPEDLNQDGTVNTEDHDILIAQMGEKCACCAGDGNHDGYVNTTDLIGVLSRLGVTCEDIKEQYSEVNLEQQYLISEAKLQDLLNILSASDLSESEKGKLEELIRSSLMITTDTGYKMSLYPSPSTNYVMISSDAPRLNLQILNVQGQVILEASMTSYEIKLDVSHLPNGIYIVRDRENVVQEQKLIITK